MVLVLDALAVLSSLLWAFGLAILGAIVAPVVFRVTGSHAADAMTIVFSRFDIVAAVCAIVLLATEAVRALRIGTPHGAARWRAGLVVLLALAGTLQGGYLTPEIRRMHESGVVRRVGADGERMDRIHRMSEKNGKGIVLGGVLVAVATLLERRRSARDPSPGPR